MKPKRVLPKPGNEPVQASASQTNKREEAIRKARERIAQLKAKKRDTNNDNTPTSSQLQPKEPTPPGRGLNVELHPLLTGKADISDVIRPVDNPNLVKFQKRNYEVNPYLNDMKATRHHRELKFNPKGKYILEGEALRKKLAAEEEERKLVEEKGRAGLLPETKVREDAFVVLEPPKVEWWDMPLLKNGRYDGDVDEEAISIYIQHPVPVNAPWERHLPPMKPMYLTKKEHKRVRRIDRAEKYKEMQDKIQLGLEPAPKPKIKLSNLMSALTNEAIKDPTKVEKRVLKEVEERKKKHLEENESRKLTKEQKQEKIRIKNQRDLSKGYHTAVFLINRLAHPSHKFKVDTNAKQLELVGLLVYTDSFVLCIVEGSEKNIFFYKKLMLNRIKWEENTIIDEKEVDLSGNKCQLLWEGQLKEPHFQRWSIFRAHDDVTALSFLSRFGVQNYLSEAYARIQQ